MINETNSGGKEVDISSVDIDAYTNVESCEDDAVKVTSMWGDTCWVSSYHLVYEKQVYFVRRAVQNGLLEL